MEADRLFGTDGIRGLPGAFPLDRATVERVGFALATVLATKGDRPRILVGRDTRESGIAIETDLTRGLVGGGGNVTSGGVLPTPAVAFLVKDCAYDLGVVVSASHNPYQDNGIKLFTRDGFKPGEGLEAQVTALALEADDDQELPAGGFPIYRRGSDPLLVTRYASFLLGTLPAGFSFEGRKVVVDCANGAASAIAPELFRRLGAETRVLHATPDGRNINDGCGTLHPESLAAAVLDDGAFIGIAYDGDADRSILVDEKGTVRDGDDLLAVIATRMRAAGTLGEAGVVATVMSNFGLETYLQSIGVELARTPVGDRHVMAEMRQRGATLGGEQSGHLILLHRATTGDGILTSLQVAHLVAASGGSLSDLAHCWKRLPQLLRNVRVAARTDLLREPAVAERIRDAEARLAGRGRVLVRYSGTEPLIRIMLEGTDAAEIAALADGLEETVTRALGPG